MYEDDDYQIYIMELSNLIKQLNIDLSLNSSLVEESKIEEVEAIKIKEFALMIYPAIDVFQPIEIIIHRMDVKYIGRSNWDTKNILTFHSTDIYFQENGCFMPDDFEVIYDNYGIRIESKYVLEDEESTLITYLKEKNYYRHFKQNYKDRVIDLMNKSGYEPEYIPIVND